MFNNYESLAYTKDFLTCEISEEKKIKRNNGIKGHVTLSLFDAKTGEKTKESYTENLIPDLYFKDVFLTRFLNGIMGVGTDRIGKSYSWFNYLYLTDSDKPENPNEQRVMGNVIGFSGRDSPYSGDDPQQSTTFTQSPYLQFPDNLKGHWLHMPFDVNVNDCMLWDQAVQLLNSDGDPLVPISTDHVKKYDGLTYAGAYKSPEGEEMIIGHYLYSKNESGVYNYYLRIYKWSKVGVFQNFTDVNLTQSLTEANTMNAQYMFEIDLSVYGEDYY